VLEYALSILAITSHDGLSVILGYAFFSLSLRDGIKIRWTLKHVMSGIMRGFLFAGIAKCPSSVT
jgi:hypothetical protein